jgi:hypothetical protein
MLVRVLPRADKLFGLVDILQKGMQQGTKRRKSLSAIWNVMVHDVLCSLFDMLRRLWAERSEIRIPGGERFFCFSKDAYWL